MRFFHLSDLHIGKYLNGYPLGGNQEQVLSQIVDAARKYRPDAVLISGDIYDKSVPSGEAYTIFEHFLEGISEIRPEIPVLIIAGNHDSPERLKYASSFLEKHHIYVSVMPPRRPEEYLKKIVLADEWGTVNFYLLPFLKPGYVKPLFEEGRVLDYESAVEAVLERECLDLDQRNVLLSHQFYVGGGKEPQTCDSEQISIQVGGLDHIDIHVLERFDYAALGHLHGPQKVGRESVRYCGSPYKYSVSEEHHKKSITLVTLEEKGKPPVLETIPLKGIQEVRRIKGTLEEILKEASRENCHDFVSVTVTDEADPYHMREQLEEVYDHLLEIRIDNQRTRKRMEGETEQIPILNPYEAFCRFYETVQHVSMTEEEEKVMRGVIETAGEEERL